MGNGDYGPWRALHEPCSSLNARNSHIAVSGPVQPMAADRKFTTTKSPGIRSRAGWIAESAGARAIVKSEEGS